MFKKYFIFINTAIIFTFVISCAPSKKFLLKKGRSAVGDKMYIKVLIKKSLDYVNLSSDSKMRIMELKSRRIIYNGHGKNINFYPENIKVPVVVESWGTPLKLDSKKYRGMIELHNVMGKVYAVNVLKMDEYLYGVVPCEIQSSWDDASLRAQAVAARTYSYYHMSKTNNLIFNVDSTTKFQVYKGMDVETERTNKAVDDTSGEIIEYGNKPIIAYFHSTCGGKTIDDRFVWRGNDMAYLKNVRCRYCKESPYYQWEYKLSLNEIRRYLRSKYKGVGRITGLSFKKANGRVIAAIIRHSKGIIRINGNNFRLLFPANKIRSLYFTARKIRNGLYIIGHGWGHGVGLCQWGARGMAKEGKDYKAILKYYYQGVNIVNMNKNFNDSRHSYISKR